MEVTALSWKEITRYYVIRGTLDREISNDKAAILIGLSKRQVIQN